MQSKKVKYGKKLKKKRNKRKNLGWQNFFGPISVLLHN